MAEKGTKKIVRRKGRVITMVATGKTGFGAWKIVSNKPAKSRRKRKR